MRKQTAELHPAFLWTCEDCGRDNFVRAVNLEPEQAIEMVPEDRQEEVEDIEGGWCIAPHEVTCSFCGMTYETEDQV